MVKMANLAKTVEIVEMAKMVKMVKMFLDFLCLNEFGILHLQKSPSLAYVRTLIRMYPKPLSSLPKWALKSGKSLPVAVTPKRLFWSNLKTALKVKEQQN